MGLLEPLGVGFAVALEIIAALDAQDGPRIYGRAPLDCPPGRDYKRPVTSTVILLQETWLDSLN